MFVTVKYADEQQLIVNSNCLVSHFLYYVQQKCCPSEGYIDLADDAGLVKNLRLTPTDNARGHLHDREVLVLLRVSPTADPEIKFTPLLDSKQSDTNFLAKLNRKPTKSAKRGGTSSESKTGVASHKMSQRTTSLEDARKQGPRRSPSKPGSRTTSRQ